MYYVDHIKPLLYIAGQSLFTRHCCKT